MWETHCVKVVLGGLAVVVTTSAIGSATWTATARTGNVSIKGTRPLLPSESSRPVDSIVALKLSLSGKTAVLVTIPLPDSPAREDSDVSLRLGGPLPFWSGSLPRSPNSCLRTNHRSFPPENSTASPCPTHRPVLPPTLLDALSDR